jgi:hypothetical protein
MHEQSMVRWLCVGGLCLLGGACSGARPEPQGSGGSGGSAGAPGPSDIAKIMAEYRSWTPRTEKPEAISSYIFGLCRAPTLPEQKFADSEHGDFRYLQDWTNARASAGFAARGQPGFAPGAVIVKEKYVNKTSGGLELVALGFMIKREAGFDAAYKDWEFAYWEPKLGVVVTREQSAYCGGCHAEAKDTDLVFVDGLKPW